MSFFLTHPATTEIFTLSLHDALPISRRRQRRPAGDPHALSRGGGVRRAVRARRRLSLDRPAWVLQPEHDRGARLHRDRKSTRLNSTRLHLVCRLLLEKKKKQTVTPTI